MGHGLWDEIEKYVWGAEGHEQSEGIQQQHGTDPGELSNRGIHLDSLVTERTPSFGDPSVRSVRQVVSEDVEQIKEMYILGKRVGKDLVDPSGRLIARRGERITRDVMQASELAGKLVELIVNMTFDRVGEAQT